MSLRALITAPVWRGLSAELLRAEDIHDEFEGGAVVQLTTSADRDKLEQAGMTVKMLPDPFRLNFAGRSIDARNFEQPSRDPVKGLVSQPHILQFSVPLRQQHLDRLVEAGIDVIGPVGHYGLLAGANSPPVPDNLALPDHLVVPLNASLKIQLALSGLSGRLTFVSVAVYPSDQVDRVSKEATELGAETIEVDWRRPGVATLFLEIDASQVDALAGSPFVLSIDYWPHRICLEGEFECEIVAGNIAPEAPGSEDAPVVPYRDWLHQVGLSGEGVTVAVCDIGIRETHEDLRPQIVPGIDYVGGPGAVLPGDHGTWVAGIAVGIGASVLHEEDFRFQAGLGVAPGAKCFSQNALMGPRWSRNLATVIQQAAEHGAQIMNNSWATDESMPQGSYGDQEAMVDRAVRSVDGTPARQDNLTLVFSSGNSGDNAPAAHGRSTLTRPKQAKNIIVAGGCFTQKKGAGQAGGTADLLPKSSRGPSSDGRLIPHIIAPGADIKSASAEDDTFYATDSGTSGSAAFVSGACALIVEWWRTRNGGATPSPAMLKALLINGAEEMRGSDGWGSPLPRIPNGHQGWGRVNVSNILRAPKVLVDQTVILTEQQRSTRRVSAQDPQRPLKITLVWTDPPPSGGPPLVNDLDLEVRETTGTQQRYAGNHFENGFSVPGGDFDSINNVECVYIQAPNQVYEVSVIAHLLGANTFPPYSGVRQQDFALVIDNAVLAP